MTDTTTTTTSGPPLGDPLPAIAARYYDAIDAFRVDEAAATFADGARYAVPLPGVVETDPRAETIGPAALRERFTDRGPKPWRHHVQLCVAEGADVLVEGVLLDGAGDPTSTFVGSFQLAADGGSITRYLAYACEGARDPIPTDVAAGVEPADAHGLMREYFAALDRGAFAAAAACFSDDVLYSHPPYKHTGLDGGGRVEFRGRAALEAAFHARGAASFDHAILAGVQRGPHCIVEGVVRGLPGAGTGSFISSLSLAADGTIRRYVSFYCEPGVRRA